MLDILTPLNQGLQIRNQRMKQQAFNEDRQRQQQIRELTAQAAQGGLGSQAFVQLQGVAPQQAAQLVAAVKKDAQTFSDVAEDASLYKSFMLKDPTGDQASKFLQNRISARNSMGQDSSRLTSLLNATMQDPNKGFDMAEMFINPPANIGQKVDRKSMTSDEKNFAKLNVLRKSGDEKGAEEFARMVGLVKDQRFSSIAEKAMVQAQDDYFKSAQSAREMEVLANDVEKLSFGGGAKLTFSEILKKSLGTQDDVTAALKRFKAIRTSQVAANLPPGAASDKDIEMAMSGFPDENASAETIASYLRGQVKLERLNQEFNSFKAEYISNKESSQGLIGAWKTKAKESPELRAIFDIPEEKPEEVVTATATASPATSSVSEQDIMAKYGL